MNRSEQLHARRALPPKLSNPFGLGVREPNARTLNCARPENDLKFHPQKVSSGWLGVILRAESDGDVERGQRARRRRFSG
eukprot:8817080-Alexandrium_andersonii.AAC.1